MNQASNWTFEQRQSLYPFFVSLCQMQKGDHFSRTRRDAYHVHQAMCDWFPEYHTELDGLKSTIQTLGLNFDKEVQDYYRTRSRPMYTGESALEELSHYTTMLAHLLAPILAKPGEDLGHLFESNEESLLGL